MLGNTKATLLMLGPPRTTTGDTQGPPRAHLIVFGDSLMLGIEPGWAHERHEPKFLYVIFMFY